LRRFERLASQVVTIQLDQVEGVHEGGLAIPPSTYQLKERDAIIPAPPWALEKQLLSSGLRLPLNLDGNPWVEAVAIVSAARLKARQLADKLEIVVDSGGPRKPAQVNMPPSLG
jgi:hypothetical protein